MELTRAERTILQAGMDRRGDQLIRPPLPDDPEPGEYRCPVCTDPVTVGESGREYGHRTARRGGPCPRRPTDLLTGGRTRAIGEQDAGGVEQGDGRE